MKLRTILWSSAALNLGLIAGVLFVLKNRPTPATSAPPALSPSTERPSQTADAIRALLATLPASQVRWSQIASDDLKIYRDNLRAIGCPALTVRDIILGEIN